MKKSIKSIEKSISDLKKQQTKISDMSNNEISRAFENRFYSLKNELYELLHKLNTKSSLAFGIVDMNKNTIRRYS